MRAGCILSAWKIIINVIALRVHAVFPWTNSRSYTGWNRFTPCAWLRRMDIKLNFSMVMVGNGWEKESHAVISSVQSCPGSSGLGLVRSQTWLARTTLWMSGKNDSMGFSYSLISQVCMCFHLLNRWDGTRRGGGQKYGYKTLRPSGHVTPLQFGHLAPWTSRPNRLVAPQTPRPTRHLAPAKIIFAWSLIRTVSS